MPNAAPVAPSSAMSTDRDARVKGGCSTCSQIPLLLRKNLAICRHNWLTTMLQCFSPVFIILIIALFRVDDKLNTEGFNKNSFERTMQPTVGVQPMPTCQTFSSDFCTTPLAIVFAAAHSDNANAVSGVIDTLITQNPQIAATDVAYYNSSAALNDAMMAAPLSVLAALHFPADFSLDAPSVTVQYNKSAYCVFGSKHCTVPWRDVQLPVQTAVERAILKQATGSDVTLTPGYARFPNPDVYDPPYRGRDFGEFVDPTFVLLCMIFSFVVMLNQLVQEKENKLKLLLRISGVTDSAMWLSWWILFFILCLIPAVVWTLVGRIPVVGLGVMQDTDPAVIFACIFMFYIAMTAFATFLSTIVRSTMVGHGIGFITMIFMWMCQGAIGALFYTSSVPKFVRNILSLFLSPFVWAKVYQTLKQAARTKRPIMWADIDDNNYICPGYCTLLCPCDYDEDDATVPGEVIMPIAEALRWWAISTVFYGILAIYLDQVIPTGYGRAQPVYYFLLPSYWCPGLTGTVSTNTSTTVVDDDSLTDSDVLVERQRVFSGGADGDAVKVVNLGKTFGGLCKPSFTAVFRVNVGVPRDTLFCLLGHNGAGKTTTFNMLSGILTPTLGDAFVFGFSVKNQLRSVQSMMGICPQHDILWPELSGTEHLRLFAGLANIPRAEIPRRVTSFLQHVDLTEFAAKACSKYSGGMRRRLSVACALIADPKVVYLDEPTTGMDPVNRRGVWNVIENAKKGRVVVLTTHAMEEADTLGDIISIMSRGRLHCIGTALHLKNKYGTGYTVDIKVPQGKQTEMLAGISELLPNGRPVGTTEIAGTVRLDEVDKMVPLCAYVEGAGPGSDMTVSMCTLETVFISIAEAAGDPEQLRKRAAQAGGVALQARAGATEMRGAPTGLAPQGQVPAMEPAIVEVVPGSNGLVRSIVVPRAPGQKLGLDMTDKKGQGVVVSKVHEGYAAAAAGNIFPGDIVTEVDGVSTAGKKRDAVFQMIGAIQGDQIKLTLDGSKRPGVTPPPSPPPSPPAAMADIEIVIPREPGQKLGLDCADKKGAVVVSKVHEGYAAAQAGVISLGDVISAVDGVSTAGKKRDGVFQMIGAIPQGTPVNLTVKRAASAPPPVVAAAASVVSSTGGAGAAAAVPVGGSHHGMGGSHHGGEADTHGVLNTTLNFKPTRFGTQFNAVAKKNFIFQKRQPCLNLSCCVLMPGLFMLVYVLLMYLPGWIVGGNTIICGSGATSAQAVDGVLMNENTQILDRALSQLRKVRLVTTAATDCPSETVLSGYGRFREWQFSGCSNNPRSRDINEGQFKSLRDAYGCNETLYQEIYPKFQYVRDSKVASDQCGEEKHPNVTLHFNGVEITEPRSCYEAFGVWLSTCTDAPTPCPSNETTAEQDADTKTEVQRIIALRNAYDCSSDVSDKLYDYRPTVVEGQYVPANVSQEHVATCMAEKYLCLEPECDAVPAFFSTFNFPACTNDTLANAMKVGAFMGKYGGNAGAAYLAGYSCIQKAADFCTRATVFDSCPLLAQTLRPTEIPFSVDASMPKSQVQALGQLRSSTDALVECTNCFADLLSITATQSTGALKNYTLKQSMSRDDAAVSLMTVSCATGAADETCAATRADLDQLLWDMWYQANLTERRDEGRYQGAYHVSQFDLAKHAYEFTVLYNGSLDGGYEQTDEPIIPALSHRLVSTIYKALRDAELKVYTMGMPRFDNTFIFDLTLFLSFCFPAILGFMQILLTFQIVAEKATNMRELMVMAGLQRRPYWVINWLYGYFVYLIQIVLFLVCAYAFGFRAIANHDALVVIVLLLCFAAQMVSYSCFMSTLFADKWAALEVNFVLLVFIFVLLGSQFAERAIGYRISGSFAQFVINLHPIFALAHAAEVMTHSGVGDFMLMSGVRLGFHNVGFDEAHPLAAIMLAMLAGTVVWMVVAYYLDVCLPVGPGVKSSWLFPFFKSTYVRSASSAAGALQCAKGAEINEAEEVIAERKRVSEQTGGVRALGLHKMYPGASRAAVVNVQFGINESECFGLLGSNGAGKTTTIHILCGLHPPTSGTVLCGTENYDIRTDLTTIQSAMGVCSQDNLLWGDLTGPEHLRFFARLRRVAPKMIKHHIDFWLRRVNLAKPADRVKYSGSYSGGMKRRLGVANAFIGNPRLVYLDEPSTGLDPESRQQLWRAVLAAKPSKSIILTTHALEEAEALCDRVGIMTFGLMRTVGTPTELRLRFDQGYKFMLACEVGQTEAEEAAHKYVLSMMSQAKLVDAINGVRTYIVPKGNVQMSALFEGMESHRAEYHIKDWGLSHTSLEEVFLQIVAANASKS